MVSEQLILNRSMAPKGDSRLDLLEAKLKKTEDSVSELRSAMDSHRLSMDSQFQSLTKMMEAFLQQQKTPASGSFQLGEGSGSASQARPDPRGSDPALGLGGRDRSEHSSSMSPKVDHRIESIEAELCNVQVVVETISRLTLKVNECRFEISEFRSEVRRLTQKMEAGFSHTRVSGSFGGVDPHIRAPGSQIVKNLGLQILDPSIEALGSRSITPKPPDPELFVMLPTAGEADQHYRSSFGVRRDHKGGGNQDLLVITISSCASSLAFIALRGVLWERACSLRLLDELLSSSEHLKTTFSFSNVTVSRFTTIGNFVDEIAPPPWPLPSSLQPYIIFVEFEFDINRSILAYLYFAGVAASLLILGKKTTWASFHIGGDMTVRRWPHRWKSCNVQYLQRTPSLLGMAMWAFDFPCVPNFYPHLNWRAHLINSTVENHLYVYMLTALSVLCSTFVLSFFSFSWVKVSAPLFDILMECIPVLHGDPRLLWIVAWFAHSSSSPHLGS